MSEATRIRPIDTWAELANALGVPIEETKRFLRAFRPTEAQALDKVDEVLSEIDDSPTEYEEVCIQFGHPYRRDMERGYWGWPLLIKVGSKEVGKIASSDTYYSIAVEGDVRVISHLRSSGGHGGNVSLRLMVPYVAEVYFGDRRLH